MIKAFIVEDSRLARAELKELLSSYVQIEIVGEADNALQAIEQIKSKTPDVVFLDIHLPGASGFDILEQLEHLPAVIFTTAFEQYALQSYEYPTIDYLLKPIVPERLAKAIDKVTASLNLNAKNSGMGMDERIFIKDGHKTWLVQLKDIRYFECKGNYAQVFFASFSPLILRSMQQLEETLSPANFIRVNRQQIVNINYVLQVSTQGTGLKLTMDDGALIEVSRRQAGKFKELFSF